MKANGKTICNMDEVLKLGQIKVDTKVSMLMEESMELAAINGTMAVSILVIGAKIRLAESGYIPG